MVLNQLLALVASGRTMSIPPPHCSDKIENNRKVLVIVNGKIKTKRWKDIRVGDVIKLGNRENKKMKKKDSPSVVAATGDFWVWEIWGRRRKKKGRKK